MSVFGEIRTPAELEAATEKHLRHWMPTYLKEVGTQQGLKLGKVGSYTVVSEYGKWPEKGLPAIVIESAGLVDTPDEDGENKLSGTFSLEVSVTAQGPDAVGTRKLAMAYGSAVVAALMQHRKLAEDIWVVELIDTAFAGADAANARTRIAVASVFHVRLENFLDTSEGPLEPEPETIPDEWPTVKSVETEVEKEN